MSSFTSKPIEYECRIKATIIFVFRGSWFWNNETRQKNNRAAKFSGRRFRSWFGTDPFIVSLIWEMMYMCEWYSKTTKANPSHLYWALQISWKNQTESEGTTNFDGVDEKTLRKWVWFYVTGISKLASDVVSLLIEWFNLKLLIILM